MDFDIGYYDEQEIIYGLSSSRMIIRWDYIDS